MGITLRVPRTARGRLATLAASRPARAPRRASGISNNRRFWVIFVHVAIRRSVRRFRVRQALLPTLPLAALAGVEA